MRKICGEAILNDRAEKKKNTKCGTKMKGMHEEMAKGIEEIKIKWKRNLDTSLLEIFFYIRLSQYVASTQTNACS